MTVSAMEKLIRRDSQRSQTEYTNQYSIRAALVHYTVNCMCSGVICSVRGRKEEMARRPTAKLSTTDFNPPEGKAFLLFWVVPDHLN
jgi:hypothetical protein